MADPLEQLADSLGRILARTLYREHLEQEARQHFLDELDAVAARTQHPAPAGGSDNARGTVRKIQQRLTEPEVC